MFIVEDRPVMQGEITQASITRVLVIGFTLVIILLVAGGSIAIHSIVAIQQNAAKLVREQSVTRRLIEELQEEQRTLSAIFYTLSGDPDTADPDKIAKRLAQVQDQLVNLERDAKPGKDQQVPWNDLLQASQAFSVEARRLLAEENVPGISTVGSRDLFQRHEQVVLRISQLVNQGFGKVSEADSEIRKRFRAFQQRIAHAALRFARSGSAVQHIYGTDDARIIPEYGLAGKRTHARLLAYACRPGIDCAAFFA